MRYHWLVRHTKSQKDPKTADDYKQAYIEWIDFIKTSIPSKQLLVYQVTEGWHPLCQFLQVSVPEDPFPCKNVQKQFQKKWMNTK